MKSTNLENRLSGSSIIKCWGFSFLSRPNESKAGLIQSCRYFLSVDVQTGSEPHQRGNKSCKWKSGQHVSEQLFRPLTAAVCGDSCDKQLPDRALKGRNKQQHQAEKNVGNWSCLIKCAINPHSKPPQPRNQGRLNNNKLLIPGSSCAFRTFACDDDSLKVGRRYN